MLEARARRGRVPDRGRRARDLALDGPAPAAAGRRRPGRARRLPALADQVRGARACGSPRSSPAARRRRGCARRASSRTSSSPGRCRRRRSSWSARPAWRAPPAARCGARCASAATRWPARSPSTRRGGRVARAERRAAHVAALPTAPTRRAGRRRRAGGRAWWRLPAQLRRRAAGPHLRLTSAARRRAPREGVGGSPGLDAVLELGARDARTGWCVSAG